MSRVTLALLLVIAVGVTILALALNPKCHIDADGAKVCETVWADRQLPETVGSLLILSGLLGLVGFWSMRRD